MDSKAVNVWPWGLKCLKRITDFFARFEVEIWPWHSGSFAEIVCLLRWFSSTQLSFVLLCCGFRAEQIYILWQPEWLPLLLNLCIVCGWKEILGTVADLPVKLPISSSPKHVYSRLYIFEYTHKIVAKYSADIDTLNATLKTYWNWYVLAIKQLRNV